MRSQVRTHPRRIYALWLLLSLGLIWPSLPQAATYAPGDSVLFSAGDTVDVPILQQNGQVVLDNRAAGVCPAGQFVTSINSTTGPTCEIGSATSGAFYVLTQPHASLPNAQLLGTGIIMRGNHASRPAAGVAGRIYFYTDAPIGWARDNGTTWDDAQLDWAQVTNRTTLAHAASHSPGQPDDISATYATKAYADAISQGLDVKLSVVAATTVALPSSTYSNGAAGVGATITGTANGALTSGFTDGITLTINQALLVKDEPTGARNGIYTLTTVGDGSNPFVLTRRTDSDSAAEVTAGLFTFIEQGTTLGDSGWVLITNNPITIGTTTLTFSQFSGGGSIIAGNGLTKTGNTLDVGAGTCITAGADTVSITAACITDTLILSLNADKLLSGTVPAARLPTPGVSTLGTLYSKNCAAANPATPYMVGVDTAGNIECTADVTGTGGAPPSATLSNLVGASQTAAALIPAGSFVWGIRVEVTLAITGPTTFSVGTVDDPTRWGNAIPGTLGYVSDIPDFPEGAPQNYRVATDVVVTANGTAFSGGSVKLSAIYTTLNTISIAGAGGGVISTISDTITSSNNTADAIAVVNGATLEFQSDDGSIALNTNEITPGPLQKIGINLRSSAPAPTLQSLVDAATGTITGLNAARPLILAGNAILGSRFELFESGGDMFFTCRLSDGTLCDHVFEIAPGKKFSLGTPTAEETMRIAYAEPETWDLKCRTTDPLASTDPDRAKLYCKNDGLYARTDTGVVGPFGAGGGSALTLDLGDDAGNDSVALSEIATTGDTTGVFTEPSADKLLINAAKPWPGGVSSRYLDAVNLVPDGTNCVSGVVQLNGGPLTDVITCADTASSSVVYGKIRMSDVGGCPTSTLNMSIHVYHAVSEAVVYDADFSAMYRRWSSSDVVNSTWGTAAQALISLTWTAHEIETGTASVTPNGTCTTGSTMLFWRLVIDGANYTTTAASSRLLGVTIAQP